VRVFVRLSLIEMASNPQVAILFPHQHAQAAAMLGRAFVDDPLIKAILPPIQDGPERARRMGQMFTVALASQRGSGQPVMGVLHEGRVGAAAIIEQADKPPTSASIVLHGLALLPALVQATGMGGVRRAVTALDVLSRNRPPQPHLYLNVLGVEPILQGRHFGVTLLDWLRAQTELRSDLIGVYLETAKEANVSYYSRMGYRVTGEIYPLGVHMWRMLQPRM
jgi:ribosomal protein S18 acetylase RimI-like enzyme